MSEQLIDQITTYIFYYIAFILIITNIYGIYLAFKASWKLGVISLLVGRSFLCYGVVKAFSGKSIPEIIMKSFKTGDKNVTSN